MSKIARAFSEFFGDRNKWAVGEVVVDTSSISLLFFMSAKKSLTGLVTIVGLGLGKLFDTGGLSRVRSNALVMASTDIWKPPTFFSGFHGGWVVAMGLSRGGL